jgi:hypothetical protein
MDLKLPSSSWRNGQIKKQKARRPLFKFWIQNFCEIPLPLRVCRPAWLQAAGSFTHSLSNRLDKEFSKQRPVFA